MNDPSITLPTKPLQQALRAAQRFTDPRYSGVRLRVRDGAITVAATNGAVLATIKVPDPRPPISGDWDRVLSHEGRKFAIDSHSDTITITPLQDGRFSLATADGVHVDESYSFLFPRSADAVIHQIPAPLATVVVRRPDLSSALRLAGARRARIVTLGTGYNHAAVIVEGEEVGRLESSYCCGHYAYCEVDSPTLLRAVRAMTGASITFNLPDGKAPVAIGAANGTWIFAQRLHRR